MTRVNLRRLVLWLPFAALLALVLFALFAPRAVPVDFALVERGPFRVSVGEEGETRVKDVFVVSAPLGGLMRRIDLDAGDPVVAGETLIARIEPSDPGFLDVRTESELRAASLAADAAHTQAAAEVERAEAELEFAESELARAKGLKSRDTISESALDESRRRQRTAVASLAEARANLAIREFERERARARLLEPSQARQQRLACDCVTVDAPVSGTVLRVLAESEGVIEAGTPLVEIGNPRDLEIVVDLLSSDAVRVAAGQSVIIGGWGGDTPLAGVVRRVEPFGFTKISALGIEEQRVNVVIDLTDPPERWPQLGHGYRVEPEIVLWEAPAVLQLPLGAVFRRGDAWAVFSVDDGRARTVEVELGRQNGLAAEIVSGLVEGQRVILHPSDRVSDGVRVTARE